MEEEWTPKDLAQSKKIRSKVIDAAAMHWDG